MQERTVKKKTKFDSIKSLLKEYWRNHQVIVMNPNKIIVRIDYFHNLICKKHKPAKAIGQTGHHDQGT